MTAVFVAIVLAVVVAVAVFLVIRSRRPTEGLGDGDAVDPPRIEPAPPRVVPAAPDRTPVAATPARDVAAPAVLPASSAAAHAVSPASEPRVIVSDDVVAPPVVAPPRASVRPAAEAKRDIAALRKGLSQTRGGWVQRLVGIFGGKKEIDPELTTAIEETLLTGDVGVRTTERLTGEIKERLSHRDLANEEVVWSTLREVAREVIDVKAPPFGARAVAGQPLVILVVGVNGVGKTTTIGKLASRYKSQGKRVLLAAADTFRAAAVAQLEAWGKRVDVAVVKGKDLSKPSAVVFDAVAQGAREGYDVVITDTAGRLHTKTPLMDELRKLRDAATKAMPGAPHEILLVLDATTGQNGVVQVKEFRDALELSGIVLTKLDGTAKGGVILGICDEFKLPVRFVGVGEKVDDLREFDAEDFTNALFTSGGDDETAAA